MAMFSVDADAAQRMIDYSGLQVCRHLPGRAIVVLMLMHYVDGDLGAVPRVRHQRDGQSAGSNAQRAARAAVGGRLHPPPARRPGVHLGGGTGRSGASRRSWPTSPFATAASSASTSASTASSRSAWNSVPACRSRRRSRRARRSMPTYSHLDGVTRETAGRDVAHRRALPARRCACPARRTPYAKELASLACRSARWSRVRPRTSR